MNHYPPPRGVMGGPPAGPSQRLNELLDNIRTEFETESQRSVDYEGQSECISSSEQVQTR
jgi:glucose repression regulatory protein TUP1